jgi:phosphatidate cytidylyltransferase
MRRALIVFVLLGLWFSVLVLGGEIGFFGLLSVVIVATTFELTAILFKNRPSERTAVMIIGSASGLTLVWGIADPERILGFALAVILVSVLLRDAEDRQRFLEDSLTFVGRAALILLILLCVAGLARLRGRVDGVEVVSLVCLCTFFRDLASNIGGRLVGPGRPICRLVNESKTWKGAIVGCIATVVLGASLLYSPYFGSIGLPRALLVAFACGVGGQIGDLFESLLKRSAGLRDSSNVFSSHQGGVLDAIDGFLGAIPLVELVLSSGHR